MVADTEEMFTASIIRVKMEAVSTCDTLVNLYNNTKRNIPEGCHLQLYMNLM
jgi:hypothetical protein